MAPYRKTIATVLANAFLAEGRWTRGGLVERAALVLGERRGWAAVARATLGRYPAREGVSSRQLATFLRTRAVFAEATGPRYGPMQIRQLLAPRPAMQSTRWRLPPLLTSGDLAAWLGLRADELSWFADERALERCADDEPLRHYRYRWLAKRTGGHRLLEAPKPRLAAIQRRILREILDVVPPHEAAHGFRPGRSVITHARAHEGRALVVRLDLADFFPSFSAARIRSLFRSLGYPDEVAHLLACLSTNVAPVMRMPPPSLSASASWGDLQRQHEMLARVRLRHLPQGAPTSPAIANLCARKLDVRLTAAARRMSASYTRYADDLVFSGDERFASQASFFVPLAGGIAVDEGFVVNHRKTRVLSQATRQHVTGLVVNTRARAPRDEYDDLRALLHNCARTGLDAQNRTGHPDFRRVLEGRVAWIGMNDPARQAKLAGLLARIPR